MKLLNNPKVLAATYNPVSKTKMFSVMVDFPTSLLAELRTHRVIEDLDNADYAYNAKVLNDLSLSANSARAIPVNKYAARVINEPFVPIWTGKKAGMSGSSVTEEQSEEATNLWLDHLQSDLHDAGAAQYVEELVELGIHKQNANRLLAPFAYTTCILSGTQWENFFELRCPKYHLDLAMRDFGYFRSKKEFMKELDAIIESDRAENHPSLQRAINKKERLENGELKWEDINDSGAQIEFQVISEMIYDLYQEADWKQSKYHIPFEEEIEKLYGDDLYNIMGYLDNGYSYNEDDFKKEIMLISASMCAKLSYDTQEKPDTLEKHLERAKHLLDNKHSEPFSHQAVAMSEWEYKMFNKTQIVSLDKYTSGRYSEKGNDVTKQVISNDKVRITTYGNCYANNGFITQRYIIENL